MEKEGRQKTKGEQEKDLSISGMVLAAKENRAWVGQAPSASDLGEKD